MTNTTPEPESDVYEPDILTVLYHRRIDIHLQHQREVAAFSDEIFAIRNNPMDDFTKKALRTLFDEVQKITNAESVAIRKLLATEKQKIGKILSDKNSEKKSQPIKRVK